MKRIIYKNKDGRVEREQAAGTNRSYNWKIA